MARRISDDAVLVIGLGRFGGALARTLEELGHEVLAVDEDMELVQEWSGTLTHVVQADATNETALRQIGAADFRVAVVAIGTALEASVLCTSVLADLGVQEIWAKAITAAHGSILARIGAQHVVYPEHDAGVRVGHLVAGKVIDFIEFEDDFAIVEVCAPKAFLDKTVAETKIRQTSRVTIVAVKRTSGRFEYAEDETPIGTGDMLVIAGPTEAVSRFAAAV